MILSDRSIREALAAGRIVVEVALGGSVLNAPLDQTDQGGTRMNPRATTSSTECDVTEQTLLVGGPDEALRRAEGGA